MLVLHSGQVPTLVWVVLRSLGQTLHITSVTSLDLLSPDLLLLDIIF